MIRHCKDRKNLNTKALAIIFYNRYFLHFRVFRFGLKKILIINVSYKNDNLGIYFFSILIDLPSCNNIEKTYTNIFIYVCNGYMYN